MAKSEIILDISLLPEQARIELMDFYEFLSRKYGEVSEERAAADEERRRRFDRFLSKTIHVGDWKTYSRSFRKSKCSSRPTEKSDTK